MKLLPFVRAEFPRLLLAMMELSVYVVVALGRLPTPTLKQY
jgi:hypothetical protein